MGQAEGAVMCLRDFRDDECGTASSYPAAGYLETSVFILAVHDIDSVLPTGREDATRVSELDLDASYAGARSLDALL
jgi:hypothetical protein